MKFQLISKVFEFILVVFTQFTFEKVSLALLLSRRFGHSGPRLAFILTYSELRIEPFI